MLSSSDSRMAIAVAALLGAAACGGNDGRSSAGATVNLETGTAAAAVHIPNACTFFSKPELESVVGSELRDGEPQSAPEGSICRFRRQLGRNATKTIADPALPASLGFTSVTIATSPYDPTAVAQIRQLDPAAFDSVPGLGDNAYFLGPNLLHVHVGKLGFSVRIDPNAMSPGDQAKVRDVMLTLGRAGASRL